MYSDSCGGMICCGKKASKYVRTYNAGIRGHGFREGVDSHQKVGLDTVATHAVPERGEGICVSIEHNERVS